jgi:hypothetical protein
MYFQGFTIPNALAEAERQFGDIPEVQEFIAYCRDSKIGICRAKISKESSRADE